MTYPPFIEKATASDYLRLSLIAVLNGCYGYAYEILEESIKYIIDKESLKKIEFAKKIILHEIKFCSKKETLLKIIKMPLRLLQPRVLIQQLIKKIFAAKDIFCFFLECNGSENTIVIEPLIKFSILKIK